MFQCSINGFSLFVSFFCFVVVVVVVVFVLFFLEAQSMLIDDIQHLKLLPGLFVIINL